MQMTIDLVAITIWRTVIDRLAIILICVMTIRTVTIIVVVTRLIIVLMTNGSVVATRTYTTALLAGICDTLGAIL